MAKRRYRRFRRRRGRWSANITELQISNLVAVPGRFITTTTLASNPAQSNTGVSQQYTAKNFEISFTIEAGTQAFNIEAVTAYIMYVPQGMTVTDQYYLQHPEYILNYKYLGSPTLEFSSTSAISAQNYQPFKLRSRMSRRLQTGDSIILLISGYNQNTANTNFDLSGIIRWWTKAN